MDRKRRWRRHAGRIIPIAFAAIVALLLADRARKIDWPAVFEALRGYDAGTLAAAAALTAIGHLTFATYDLLARRYAGHHLPAPKVLGIAATSYVFNLNLGALLGGMGFRYRLYSRAGLAVGQILRVIAFALATNWTGYLLVAGAVFLLAPPALPSEWPIGEATLRALGGGLLLLLAIWLLACALSRRRQWRYRHLQLRLPGLRLACAQLALAAASWIMIALVIERLMPAAVTLPTVMGVYYLGTQATLVLRIPGGLGVIEAVFLALLGGTHGEAPLLAALLVWRALYYLLPLLIAIPGFLLLDRRHAAPMTPLPGRSTPPA